MDILYTIIKTGGYLISLGIIAIVPVLFIAALLGRLPWVIAAPGMALVAFLAAYPAGMFEGISQERTAWEIKVYNLRAALEVKQRQANEAVAIVETKYLAAEADKVSLREEFNDTLIGLVMQSTQESEPNENPKCPVCNPYTMRADARILRNIQKR